MTHIIEHFEGHVTSIKEDSFGVDFEDIAEDRYCADMITDKVLDNEEKEYLEIGMPFDLIFFNTGGSKFRFIKEVWTQEELDKCKKEAERISKEINWKSLPIAED